MNPRSRCAIYTRKSSEEGLEQSFNSLHAQREACEAYIKSQQHEGWKLSATRYDDGGFSGGNMDRPAFKQLMADIASGRISVVVVYKVDRLTRSLTDFAKMVEQFDKHGVSFVSVTQQFNTTTSMGRLTLNVLLSFAQFEREVTGERIRDKIAASKQKGMWMGGTVPLGYTAQDRKLVVNEVEAATVRSIFDGFLRAGSVYRLQEWLRTSNITNRRGNHFFRGPLYTILRNPHYLGRIKHKKLSYAGTHTAIVDHETWDQAQVLLGSNTQGERRKGRVTKESLFTGMPYDVTGILYTPTHANKNGRRYRYYTSQAAIKRTQSGDAPARIPAPDLEKAIIDRLLEWLQTPEQLLTALRDETDSSSPEEGFYSRLNAQAVTTARSWLERTAEDRTLFLKNVIRRVIVHRDHVDVRLHVPSLVNEIIGAGGSTAGLLPIAVIECPFHHVRQGRAVRLVVGNTSLTTDASRMAILKAIARARRWYEQITSGEVSSIEQLASMHRVSPRLIHKHMRLVPLSPQRVEGFMTRPESMPISLHDLLTAVPINWREQTVGNLARSA